MHFTYNVLYKWLLASIFTSSLPWNAHAALDPAEMARHLTAGKPILGTFSNPSSPFTSWMGKLRDSTPIEAINIPGTHDTCAWNYTGPNPQTFNCQDRPIFDQLNAGIRFLDIRFGLDENTNKLRVYHADALLSDTVELEDVLWGFYHFLDVHPTETLLVSMKVDHGDTSIPVQETAHALITAPPVNQYWIQSTTLRSNIGAARGKIILFRRFGFDSATNPDLTPVGLDVSSGWADNNPDFSITYSAPHISYIEDLYMLIGDIDQVSPMAKVQTKFDALTSHIINSQKATNISQIFISFASGSGSGVGDILTPKALAVGNASAHLVGINEMMDEWLTGRTHQRLGIVLYDFYESRPALVAKTIGGNYV